MTIEFQDGDSIAAVINTGLVGYTADVTYVTGGPHLTVSIVGTEGPRLIFRAAGIDGEPVGPTSAMPLDAIGTISIL